MAKHSRRPPKRKTISSEEFPRIHGITEKILPEIKEWHVGNKYKLIAEVEQIVLRKEEYGNNKDELVANFKILNIKNATEKIK